MNDHADQNWQRRDGFSRRRTRQQQTCKTFRFSLTAILLYKFSFSFENSIFNSQLSTRFSCTENYLSFLDVIRDSLSTREV